MSATTAVIIVIGDEILKGQVQDTNSHYLAGRLAALGVRTLRVLVLPDDISVIADTVRLWSAASNYVITTGGVGPTHDDVTYEAIARAFDVPLKRSAELARVMKAFIGCQDAGKMAMIPERATIVRGSVNELPVVRVDNVFILPGVPVYCQACFSSVQSAMLTVPLQFFTQTVIVMADETVFLAQINALVDRFTDRVTVGSYPFEAENAKWHTRISLESINVDDLCEARAYLINSLDSGMVDTRLNEDDMQKVYDLAAGATTFAKSVASAIEVVEKALSKYKVEEIALSFNGGKDCTVLLHLLWAVYLKNKSGSICTMYVSSEDTFPEITEFMEVCRTHYSLNIITVPGPIKPGLETLLASRPQVKAVWMGTRRSDPHSHTLKPFQKCDAGWPPLMRVSPLLDWTYEDVWTYLRCLAVPYCSLYDRGYTSLGSRSNTQPNPSLYDKNTKSYLPAYRLHNGQTERSGRS